MAITQNTFGSDISSDDILDTLGFFDDWEERYKYIIDLGKQLPAMADEKKPTIIYCAVVRARCGSTVN